MLDIDIKINTKEAILHIMYSFNIFKIFKRFLCYGPSLQLIFTCTSIHTSIHMHLCITMINI